MRSRSGDRKTPSTEALYTQKHGARQVIIGRPCLCVLHLTPKLGEIEADDFHNSTVDIQYDLIRDRASTTTAPSICASTLLYRCRPCTRISILLKEALKCHAGPSVFSLSVATCHPRLIRCRRNKSRVLHGSSACGRQGQGHCCFHYSLALRLHA